MLITNVLVAFHMQRAFQPQHTFFATACFPLAAVRRTNSTRALVHFLSLFRSLNVWVRESCIFDVNGLSSAHNVNYNVVQPTTDTHGRGHHMRVVRIALHQIRRDNRPKTTKYFALPTFFPEFFARNQFSCAWILCRWQNPSIKPWRSRYLYSNQPKCRQIELTFDSVAGTHHTKSVDLKYSILNWVRRSGKKKCNPSSSGINQPRR